MPWLLQGHRQIATSLGRRLMDVTWDTQKTDLLQEFAAALAKGRRGQFQKKDFKYGINLTTSTTNFRGQTLGETHQDRGVEKLCS